MKVGDQLVDVKRSRHNAGSAKRMYRFPFNLSGGKEEREIERERERQRERERRRRRERKC